MSGSVNDYVKELVRLARAYRAAEAQIARAYFSRRRAKRSHLRWLRAQGFKEHSAIKPLLVALAGLYPEIGISIDRRQYEELAEKLADETRHARLILDLLEAIGGKKATPRDFVWLPEDRKLAKVRARFSKTYAGLLHGSEAITAREIRKKDEQLERAAITLTEGGGGAIYEICSRLKRPGLERKIARVFKQIYRDEIQHKEAGMRALATLIKSKKDYERAARIICEVSSQRLRMRSEQFGFPLSEAALAALEERVKKTTPKVSG